MRLFYKILSLVLAPGFVAPADRREDNAPSSEDKQEQDTVDGTIAVWQTLHYIPDISSALGAQAKPSRGHGRVQPTTLLRFRRVLV